MEFHTKTICVNATEFRDAFEYISMGSVYRSRAYICVDTERIYCKAEADDYLDDIFDTPLPEDLETSDRYIAMPHKNELDLGRRLVIAFIEQELPRDYDLADSFLRRSGAYRWFKDLLDARGKTQIWYDYAERATDLALRQWCEDNAIQLLD